ncbi:MAG: PAS domain S-box protein [Desulfobacterales bacterium]|jgi:PAS domain S-box-containing protein
MKDTDKTKEELLAEIAESKRRIEELEKSQADHRKTVEEALRESEAKYRQLVDIAPAGIYEIDLATGKIISVNEVACKYMGYTKEEFLGSNHLDFLTEESLKKAIERYDKIQRGEPVPNITEYDFIGKNGRELVVLVNTRIDYENGQPVKVTVIAHDITEKKRLEEELLKAQKLESLGVLAGGIAHDFNNFLSGIMGNISLAKLEADQGEDIIEALDEALRVTSRASALTRQLLVFSKGGAPVKKTASISEVLRDSTVFALRGSKAKCEFNIVEGLWPVSVDIGQFSQVIHNLSINAVQAMPQGGVIRLNACNVALEGRSGLPLEAGRYVKISIQDEGLGIPQEHLAKIFDPYFTTKHKGSGLGLSMSYTTIHAHDGHIAVDSEMGKGTTFSIYMPASYEKLVEKGDREDKLIKGQGRILVMDDDESIRNVTEKILMELGYDVCCASDGSETITIYQDATRSGQPFDAVIMDLTIPGGMGGKETIQQLLKIDPKVTAIVSSGYSNDPIMSDFENYGFRGVATKPYSIEKLSWVLHDVLLEAKERD